MKNVADFKAKVLEKVSKDETTKDKSNLSETTEDQTRNKTKTESESTGEVISFDKFKKKK